MQKATLKLFLFFVTLAAVGAALLWAARPLVTPLLYLYPTGWTDAELIRHVWHFRLVQPEWASTPPDYLHWSQTETMARLSVVFLAWLTNVALVVRYFRRHQAPPNKSLQATAAAPCS